MEVSAVSCKYFAIQDNQIGTTMIKTNFNGIQNMVKSNHNKMPALQDVLEVLGLIPASGLGQLLLADKHNHRPQLSHLGVGPRAPKRKRSLAEAATILRTSTSCIRRILKVAEAKGQAGVVDIRWGRGQW